MFLTQYFRIDPTRVDSSILLHFSAGQSLRTQAALFFSVFVVALLLAAAAAAATDGNLPVILDVVERAGVARPEGVVEGGVPLARGLVAAGVPVRLVAEGRPVAARLSPLSLWPDGSIRWLGVTFASAFQAGETKRFILERGVGLQRPVVAPPLPSMVLRVATDTGVTIFPVRQGFRRQGDLSARIDVEPLTRKRVRLRIEVAQHAVDARWRSVTLEIADPGPVVAAPAVGAIRGGRWSVAIRHAVERGPTAVEAAGDTLKVHLYPPSAPPYPADAGFHVTRVVVLERGSDPRDLARRLAIPLRPVVPAAYVDATRAIGRTGVSNALSSRFDASFRRAWDGLRRQQEDPHNRGWTAWGDFFDRRHGMAYAGYLNQEYDPATAFLLFGLRSGDPAALDTGLDMARQYADNGVGLDGGCFQHRATYHALERHIARAAAVRLRQRWRQKREAPATEKEILTYVQSQFGKKAARKVAEHARGLAVAPPTAVEQELSEWLGYGLVRAARDSLRTKLGKMKAIMLGLQKSTPPFRAFARYYLDSRYLKTLGLPAVDDLFTPFFARYGGSWEDFPAFHFCELPDPGKAHGGAHCLAEMLVYGHLLTGDPALRRAALQVARYHLDGGLVTRAIRVVGEQRQGGAPVGARRLGWPLVNLLAVELLTEGQEPALHRRVEGAVETLVAELIKIEPDQYEGIIHVAVASLGLARYQERTGDARAEAYLQRLVRYWVEHQWDGRRHTFHYMKDGGPADPSLSAFFLYGLSHVAWRSGDSHLRQVAEAVFHEVENRSPTYVKEFAQQFHNSQRALSFWQEAGSSMGMEVP